MADLWGRDLNRGPPVYKALREGTPCGALMEEALHQITPHNTAFGDVALDIWQIPTNIMRNP
jgi:hypothetical protein